MNPSLIKNRALALCEEVRKCDDTLGAYSDHEGDESGPAFYFWSKGFREFAAHCDRAIADHKAAIKTWRKFKRFNEKREAVTPQSF